MSPASSPAHAVLPAEPSPGAPAGAAVARPLPPPAAPGRAGYWLFAAHLLTLFGIALSNVLLGLTVLASPWTARRPAAGWARLAVLWVPLGVYALWLLAAIAASYDPRTSLTGTRELFTLATLGLAPLLVQGERDVRRLRDGLIALGALLAGWGLAQYFLGYGDLHHRIRGPFSHYMTFAGVLLIADLLLLAAMTYGGRRPRPWHWAALALINAALLGSLTRSAWVALVLTLALLALTLAPRLLLLALPAALLFVLLAPVPLLHRAVSIADLADTSNYDRLCMLEAGLRMIAERPLFGIGPEMVERRYPIYRPPTAPRHRVPHLHDSYLQVAAERGLPALAAFLALLAGSLWTAYRLYAREGGRRGPRADLLAGSMLALLAFGLAGLFEHNWGDTEVQRPILFVLAIPFCLLPGTPVAPAGE